MNKLEKLEWLEREIAELKKEIEDEVKGFPQDGDDFYYIDPHGTIKCRNFIGLFSSLYGTREIGNCFKTEEEAEFVVEKLKVIQELKKYSKEFEYLRCNYYLYYDYCDGKITTAWSEDCVESTLYFESEEMVKKAIEAVGEDRIKKYYLGIKED